MPEIRVEPPVGGLSDDQSFTDQPPRTTRDAKNVRLLDPGTGRTRLAQRSGLLQLVAEQVSGSNKVQHLATIADGGSNVVFASAIEEDDILLEWAQTFSKQPCRDITTDATGLVYAIDGPSNVRILNREGTPLGNISVGLTAGGLTMLSRVLVDELTGNVFVCDVPKATWDTSGVPSLTLQGVTEIEGTGDAGHVRMYVRVGAGYTYELAWTSEVGLDQLGAPTEHIYDIDLRAGALYVLFTNPNPVDGGGFIRKYVLGGLVPQEVSTVRFETPGEHISSHGHIAATDSGDVFVGMGDTAGNLEDDTPVFANSRLYKLDSSLAEVYKEIGSSFFVFGVALHYNAELNRVYSLGWGGASSVIALDASANSFGAANLWNINDSDFDVRDPYMVIDSDDLGDIYVPAGMPGDVTVDRRALRWIPSDGTNADVLGYSPAEQTAENISQGYYAAAADSIGLPFVADDSNLIPFDFVYRLEATVYWNPNASISVVADADEGPFFDGRADALVDSTGAGTGTLTSDPITDTLDSPVLSCYVKPDPDDTPSKSRIQLAETSTSDAWSAIVDWSQDPPAVSLTLDGTAAAGQVGVTGPVNGYYRVFVRALETISNNMVIRFTPANETGSDTGTVYFYGPKLEESPTGKPTDLGQRFGTELAYLGAEGKPPDSITAEEPEDWASTRAIRFVTAEVNNDVTRRRANVAVANGDLKLFSEDGITAIVNAQHSLDPLQGLSPDAPFVDSTVAFGYLIFVDGARALTYDVQTGTIENYKAMSAGSLPKHAGLITTWGGRVVLAGFAGARDDWAMSAIADPFDWDFGTVINVPTAAVNGTTAPFAGRVPDIVTALIPISDDLMLFGGDQSIHRLTGNPKVDGQLDLISDITGIAFGKAWAKDPEGNLYFMGSKGRLYVAPGGTGQPKPVTERTIDRRLEAVDLESYRYQLEWNYRERGLHIFTIPYGAGGTAVDHWFFERKNGGIWEDRMATTSHQPTAALVLDGDTSDDRVLILGCEDGRLRVWDEDASDDDGTGIDAYCLIGPYHMDSDREVKLTSLRGLLAHDQDGASIEVFAEDEPWELSAPKFLGELAPGRNPNMRLRARGSYAYVRIRNAAAGQRWALESLYATLMSGSRRRVRT